MVLYLKYFSISNNIQQPDIDFTKLEEDEIIALDSKKKSILLLSQGNIDNEKKEFYSSFNGSGILKYS